MRTKFICAILAIGGAATLGISKMGGPRPAPTREPHEHHEQGHEIANKVLRAYYNTTAETHVIDSFDVNGVKVFTAAVVRNGVEDRATVTANGDYIAMGLPQPIEAISPGARDMVQLFKTPAKEISQQDLRSFFVAVKGPLGRPYDVEFDAAGRIRDIKAPEEIREDAVARKADGPIHHKISEFAKQQFPTITAIDGVYHAVHDPGYFLVIFRAQDNRAGWAIINPENDVTEWRQPIHHDNVPEAVRRGVERELRGNEVRNISMGATRLYQVKIMVGGELLSMLIRPNGAVDWMNSRELHRHALLDSK